MEDIKNKMMNIQEIEKPDFLQVNSISESEKRKILKERAKLYSKPLETEVSDIEILELIVFILGGEKYGIESKYIREVFPLKDYAAIPGTPDFILGIANVRSQIVSMVNLKKLFNLSNTGIGDFNKLIILENEDMEFGVLADSIIGYVSIPIDTINQIISTENNSSDFLTGTTINNIIVIDIVKIINNPNLIVNQF